MSAVPEDPFAAVLARLLGPLAHAMVSRGVTVQAATESLKQALCAAAVEIEGDQVSDSRVSLLTGLHRKDVKRLRTMPADRQQTRSANAVAMAVSYWATAPEFQGADGAPRDLGREDDPAGPGLIELIRRTRADMAPGTVLAAMLDQGVTRPLEDGRYRLAANAFLPDAGSTALVAAYEATLSAHLRAATHNLVAPEGSTRHFDRVVRYSHLSDASVQRLTLLAAERAQALLEEVNALALQLQQQDAEQPAPQPSGHFAFGAYVMPRSGHDPTGQSTAGHKPTGDEGPEREETE